MLTLRWLTWSVALLLIAGHLAPEPALRYALPLLLLTAAALTILTLVLPYLSHPRSLLAVGALDIAAGLGAVALSDGWSSPFILYSYSTLLLPFLLLPLRHRLLLALLFALLDVATLVLGDLSLGALFQQAGAMLIVRLSLPFGLALLIRAESPVFLPARSLGDKRLVRKIEGAARRFHRIAMLAGPTSAGREATALVEVQAAADRGERELQGLLALLRPADAYETDMLAHMRELVASFHDRSGIEASFKLEGLPRQLPPAVEATLLAVSSEALTNIEKHAHAAEAEILLRYEASDVVLTIRDNGVGLMDGPVDRPGCHGLRALQYRVAELNGQLEVFEGNPGGVVVRVTVPLEVFAA